MHGSQSARGRALCRLAGAAALVTLAGCAGDPLLTAAELALNGASYVATGKSAEEHGLSLLSGQSCKLARMLDGEPVCRRAEDDTSTATLADGRPEPTSSAIGTVYRAAAGPPPVIDGAPPSPAALGRYLVLASFEERDDAAHVARTLRGLRCRVAPFTVREHTVYRVLVGPIEDGGGPPMRRRLAQAGVTGAWPARLCRDSLRPPPCGAPPAAIRADGVTDRLAGR